MHTTRHQRFTRRGLPVLLGVLMALGMGVHTALPNPGAAHLTDTTTTAEYRMMESPE